MHMDGRTGADFSKSDYEAVVANTGMEVLIDSEVKRQLIVSGNIQSSKNHKGLVVTRHIESLG